MTSETSTAPGESAALHRQLRMNFLPVVKAQGNILQLEDGRAIFDASGGASVSCIGHGDKRVMQAIEKQLQVVEYCASIFFTTVVQEELCAELLASTDGQMSKAYIVNSGSEAMEAALKLARQYFLEKSTPEPGRCRFISRNQSYHGITLGSLAVGGHKYRRSIFEPLLMDKSSQVSPCYQYRRQIAGESDNDYVARLCNELDQEFMRVGPETVCAFIAEPVVGAALGCVTAVPGYFEAVRRICDKHGALLILDEVMCGMGRTGTLHAWQQEGVVPDIQTIGKGFGGGYQPISGLLANKKVIDVLKSGSGAFLHGHTYQGHPIGCAAALQVQRIIKSEGLLGNVQRMGQLLLSELQAHLLSHPNIGDIRGRGLFIGIEFVQEKAKKTPFPASKGVSIGISELGLLEKHSILVYPGSGSVNGDAGDHIIISPAFNVTPADISTIVKKLVGLINDYFHI